VDAAVVKKPFLAGCFSLGIVLSAMAQEFPQNELQINFSGYFDSFDVSVVYPNVSLSLKLSESTSITGRYLVDMITAASIKTGDEESGVDAVTSASQRSGILSLSLDDLRHEFGGGITQLFLGNTISLNGIYSVENDYTSATFAGTITRALAKKNTTLQLGFVRSWDKVFPLTKNGEREKEIRTFSANLSQVLGAGAIMQLLFSFTENSGHLSDDYKLVIIDDEAHDPIHPNYRARRAAATRFKFRLDSKSSLQLGYRYYWDDWNITSHTGSTLYQRHLSSITTVGLGFRGYSQSRAFFYKPEYAQPEPFMTVDNKLDSGYATSVQFDITLNGGPGHGVLLLPFMGSENLQYKLSLSWYRRHTDSPDWFSGQNDLHAVYFNFGIRYHF